MKKYLKYLLVSLSLVIIASCEDESKNRVPTPPNGAFVYLDVDTPVIDVTNIDSSSYDFTLTAPAGNIESYELSVNRNGGDDFPILTITKFPTSVSISAADIANALGITVADLQPGDAYNFSALITDKNGNESSIDNLNGDAKNPGERQAFKHTTYLSCPFNAADAAGLYQVTFDGFFEDQPWDVEILAGPGENQITMKNLYEPSTGQGGYDIVIDVDPNTGIATVENQGVFDTDAFGWGYGEAKVRTNGPSFVFSCSGTITLLLNYNVSLGSFGTFQFSLQKQ